MRKLLFAGCLSVVACGASSTLPSGGDPSEGTGGSSVGVSGGGMGGRTTTAPGAAQQLSSKLATWCPEVCRTLSQCPVPPCTCQGDLCSCIELPDPATCPAECQSGMGQQFLGHGDPCAQIGLAYVDCLSAITCDALTGSGDSPCAPDPSAQAAACEPTAPPPSGVVVCQGGSGSAAAGGTGVTPGTMVCDLTRDGCSDGRAYRVSCTYLGPGAEVSCSCYLDGLPQTSFPWTAGGSSCPPVQEVNAGCGWQLAAI
jgi:hypothetical protein